MKTFGKIIICIIVVILAIGISYFICNSKGKNINNTSGNVTNNTQTNNEENNNTTNENVENPDYIGEEEKVEAPEDDKEEEDNKNENQENNPGTQETELTGKDKAIDIVKREYAIDDQTVRFDHMEGTDYIIKINDGTAVTWYLVNGTTWEAEEY